MSKDLAPTLLTNPHHDRNRKTVNLPDGSPLVFPKNVKVFIELNGRPYPTPLSLDCTVEDIKDDPTTGIMSFTVKATAVVRAAKRK